MKHAFYFRYYSDMDNGIVEFISCLVKKFPGFTETKCMLLLSQNPLIPYFELLQFKLHFTPYSTKIHFNVVLFCRHRYL